MIIAHIIDSLHPALLGSSVHEEQINGLKRASETRLENLKREVVTLEAELEEVRYKASVAVGHSTKEQKKELLDKQGNLRHIKERSEASQQLVQNLQEGLSHIAETLGLPPREEDAPVGDLLRDIEAVLETLMEEREKQQQQQQQQLHGHSGSSSIAARENPQVKFGIISFLYLLFFVLISYALANFN